MIISAFSNTKDKIAIIAIRVKILFFLKKSKITLNYLIIKFLIRIAFIKNIITILMESIYVGDLVPSIASYKKTLKIIKDV